jgi:hypothetical protein
LPFHHPLQLAEQAAMVDVLSSGRLEFGVGRGSQRYEYERLGVPLMRKAPALKRRWRSSVRPGRRKRLPRRGVLSLSGDHRLSAGVAAASSAHLVASTTPRPCTMPCNSATP